MPDYSNLITKELEAELRKVKVLTVALNNKKRCDIRMSEGVSNVFDKMFLWINSPEGHDYWMSINDKIINNINQSNS